MLALGEIFEAAQALRAGVEASHENNAVTSAFVNLRANRTRYCMLSDKTRCGISHHEIDRR